MSAKREPRADEKPGDRMDGGEIETVESTPVGDKSLAPAQLEWTGERFVPEVAGDSALEHVHRYLMAREMARDRVVLDIASGEGYGSALLADVARKVVGVDLSPEAVEHAARQYTRHNLHFALGSCSKIPLPDSSIDLAVSFETIEHHHEHESMMQELKRVLRPRGKLIISSRDKYAYADRAGHHNPFHVKELYRHEFEDLVKRYFAHTAFYGQRVLYGSTILREDGATRVKSHQHQDGQATRPWTPMYWIAVASDIKSRLGVSSVLNKPLEGACIYYYWFNGKRLLEKPLQLIHENPDIDLDYCLCWANENWTRTWDGTEKNVLIAQHYSEQDDLDFIAHISKYFSDKRYIRVHDRPLLLVYRLDLLPDPKASTARWRQYCRDEGIGEIFLVTAQFTENPPEEYGADAGVEFPPHRLSGPAFNGIRDVHGLSASFDGGIHDYNEIVMNSTALPQSSRIFRTVTMAWDNTPRRLAGEPTIFINCTPARYERWLSRLCRETKLREKEERLVFINAWNEWAEGVYLEPDRDRGYAYINATRRAVSQCEENIPRIAVVLHLFYWDLVDELADHIANIPFPFDLYVTATEGIYSQAFSYFNHRFPQASVNVVEVENRERYIGPFLTKFSSRYYDYDLICKVHTKKSPHAPNLSGWRMFLLDRLLGSDTQIREVVDEFDRDPELGLIYPTYYPEVQSSISWGPNRHIVRDLLSWLEIGFDAASFCNFPAGSMFWFRPQALSTLIDFDFLIEEFPEETGQTDGTLAHRHRTWLSLRRRT